MGIAVTEDVVEDAVAAADVVEDTEEDAEEDAEEAEEVVGWESAATARTARLSPTFAMMMFSSVMRVMTAVEPLVFSARLPFAGMMNLGCAFSSSSSCWQVAVNISDQNAGVIKELKFLGFDV